MDQRIPPPKPKTSWEERTAALTHVITHPTPTPSLHSQFLFSTLIPKTHQWDYYPPLSSTSSSPLCLLRWSFSLFLRRLRRPYLSSWRSKCPYQQPPPLVVSSAVGPAEWGPEERRAHFRKRMGRVRLGIKIPTFIGIAVPNLMLMLLLYWDPLWNWPQ